MITTSARAAVQRAALAHELAAAFGFAEHPHDRSDAAAAAAPVQRHGDAHTGLSDDAVASHAAAGVSGAGGVLPHLESIQRAFGPAHDLSGVRAHVGGAAANASSAIGAHAYATGNDLAFSSSPDLFLAAHEATHIVQQRQGVHLKGVVGQAGDSYEQHADTVAAAVVRGEDVSGLLGGGEECEPATQVQRWAIQRSDTQSSSPVKKLSGSAAAAHVARILPKFQALGIGLIHTSLGPVQMVPGSIWSGDRMLLSGGEAETYFTMGNSIYYQGTPQFVRDQWFGALSKAGQNAMGMVYLAKIEAALLEGLFVPWWGMLGLSLAEAAVFYETHETEARAAIDAIPPLLKAIDDIRRAYPTLFKTLIVAVLKEAPSGVSAADVAFFVGRFMSGAASAAGTAAETLTTVSLKTLALIALKCASLVTLTHAPAILAGATSKVAKRQIEKIQATFAEGGLPIDDASATAIAVELASDPAAAKVKLIDLANSATAVVPVLEQLKGLAP